MTSQLIITTVEELQSDIVLKTKTFKNKIGIYVSLNKTQKSTEDLLRKGGVETSKLFFIDCVSKDKVNDEVLHIPPESLDVLSVAIQTFIKDIPGEKFMIIDALSTLLIYNNENKVAKFVQEVTEYATDNQVHIVAFSPKTQGEELLNKIFNFFDTVENK